MHTVKARFHHVQTFVVVPVKVSTMSQICLKFFVFDWNTWYHITVNCLY